MTKIIRGTVKVSLVPGDRVWYRYQHCLRPGRYTTIQKLATFLKYAPNGDFVIKADGNRCPTRIKPAMANSRLIFYERPVNASA